MGGESESFVSSESEYADEETQLENKLKACGTAGGIKKRANAGAETPFDIGPLLSLDSMAEEMNVMKQVFLRMSEKKIQQKEERKKECKRLYMEAFESDVDRLFKRANKLRGKKMNEVSVTIEGLGKQIQSSSSELRNSRAAYKKRFEAEFEAAQTEIDRLKRTLQNVDDHYLVAKQKIEVEFHKLDEDAETTLQALETKLLETWEDKSFVKAFKSQVERLL